MAPGYYVDNIVFNSNGGEGIVEVFVEVVPDKQFKVIDIYRYYNGTDYLVYGQSSVGNKKIKSE